MRHLTLVVFWVVFTYLMSLDGSNLWVVVPGMLGQLIVTFVFYDEKERHLN